jgi:NDP-sugar pyrophosphorylase family protein
MEHIEFQIIIAVDYDDGHLFPLTENLPKCLLPIANQTLLRMQLNILESFGAKGIFSFIFIYFKTIIK